MKKIMVAIIVCFSHILYAKTTPLGVKFINNIRSSAFIHVDKSGGIWSGGGARNKNGIRNNDGLYRYNDSGGVILYYLSGIFTDVLETDSNLLFTNYSGIYSFKNNQFKIDNSVLKSTCIANYKGKILIGTYGNGLYEKTTSGYQKIPIIISGKAHDSINCISAYGNDLWIGTSNGLILYNGSSFQKYILPLKNTWSNWDIKNQKEIISLQKDIDGKLWVLNNNNTDSLECLYFLENNSFESALRYYNDNCIKFLLFPSSANRLSINNNGNILLGIDYGLLVLEKNNFRYYQVENSNFINQCYIGTLACGDKNGNIYLSSSSEGLFKITPSKYDNSNTLFNSTINYNSIDINDIKSNVTNTGINLKGNATNKASLYNQAMSIPKIGCATPIYSGAIWMGGIKNNTSDLHIAAETYRQSGNDFKPGPIDLITKTYDSTANSFYNKIWKINRQTIDEFLSNRNNTNYVIPYEILDWPAHGRGNFAKNLAPFVDVNANGIYEPQKGDYPKIKGDQMLWWVFNDLGEHKETQGTPLSVEIHGSCYAYYNINLPISDSNYILNRTIFFNYKTFNRSSNDYLYFYTSIWNDVDLGNYSDDYVGCDTINNASFGYNADNFDEGNNGFGKNPPVIYCQFLNQKMTTFSTYNNSFDPINGNPNISDDYYNFMKGKSKNKKFDFAGKICNSNNVAPQDKRSLMSTYIPIFKKDSIFELEFAYSVLYDPSKDWLKEDCDNGSNTLKKIQNWYNKNQFPSKPYWGLSVNEIEKNKFTVFPNPSNSILNIQTSIYSEKVTSIELIDITGKIIEKQLSNTSNIYFNTTFDISKIATGIYIIKINTDNGSLTQKIIKE